ncbi:protein NIM1-interacting 2 [Tanacetum coccineum]
METSKKKRFEAKDDVKICVKKTRSKRERYNGGVTADDAEVDEFFAILKRLQTGFDYLRSKGVDGSCSGSWNPAFELEDFGQVDDGVRKANDNVVGFDLNVDPTTE